MNDMELLFGQYSTLKSFWFDTDPGECQTGHMITPFLKIKNGEVIESQCKSNTASIVTSANDNVSDVVDSGNDENSYKCTDDWIKYENRRNAQNEDKHNQQFSSLEEAKTACMKLSIDDCISIDENRKNENAIVFYLKRFSVLTNDQNNPDHSTYQRPKCSPDG